jgi:two-component system cell cycle response regulator CpdR
MAHILLAEDDDSLRGFLRRALEKRGHDVCAVRDGEEAADAMASDRFDLILADIVMPGIDGIELAHRAREKWPDLPIMFITGFAAVALRARNEFEGRTKIMSKPFHLRELVEEVEKALAHEGGRTTRPRRT